MIPIEVPAAVKSLLGDADGGLVSGDDSLSIAEESSPRGSGSGWTGQGDGAPLAVVVEPSTTGHHDGVASASAAVPYSSSSSGGQDATRSVLVPPSSARRQSSVEGGGAVRTSSTQTLALSAASGAGARVQLGPIRLPGMLPLVASMPPPQSAAGRVSQESPHSTTEYTGLGSGVPGAALLSATQHGSALNMAPELLQPLSRVAPSFRRQSTARKGSSETVKSAGRGGVALLSSLPNAHNGPLELHVLFVDDEVVNRNVAKRMLQRLGCTTVELADGDEVEAALQATGQLSKEGRSRRGSSRRILRQQTSTSALMRIPTRAASCGDSDIAAVASSGGGIGVANDGEQGGGVLPTGPGSRAGVAGSGDDATGEVAVRDPSLPRPFDVIMLDIQMKRMNGDEVCRRLRNARVDIMIVATTGMKGQGCLAVSLSCSLQCHVVVVSRLPGNCSETEMHSYIETGFDAVLPKPFNQVDIRRVFTKLLEDAV